MCGRPALAVVAARPVGRERAGVEGFAFETATSAPNARVERVIFSGRSCSRSPSTARARARRGIRFRAAHGGDTGGYRTCTASFPIASSFTWRFVGCVLRSRRRPACFGGDEVANVEVCRSETTMTNPSRNSWQAAWNRAGTRVAIAAASPPAPRWPRPACRFQIHGHERRRSGLRRGTHGRREEMFEVMDANRDGRVTAAEMDAAHEGDR
jgi:hypothetical protein